MRAPTLAALVMTAGVLTACSSSSAPVPAGPAVPGGLSQDALRGLLLQAADLPSTATRRDSATTTGTTDPAAQLALCQAPRQVALHQVASVIAKPAQAGQAQVFELVSAFPDAVAAQAAFGQADTAATACGSYTVDDTAFTVADLGHPAIAGADEALQYRLTTADVVRGDVRTVARSGRFLVLVSGFGAPPGGATPLAFQADVMAKALARLPRA